MARDFRFYSDILFPLKVLILGLILCPGINADNHGGESYAEKSWDVCKNSSDFGTKCGEYMVKWFFNETADACDRFWYGGCDGNDNRFDTEAECLDHCKPDTKGTGRFRYTKCPFPFPIYSQHTHSL